jgi:hypothetical protein
MICSKCYACDECEDDDYVTFIETKIDVPICRNCMSSKNPTLDERLKAKREG